MQDKLAVVLRQPRGLNRLYERLTRPKWFSYAVAYGLSVLVMELLMEGSLKVKAHGGVPIGAWAGLADAWIGPALVAAFHLLSYLNRRWGRAVGRTSGADGRLVLYGGVMVSEILPRERILAITMAPEPGPVGTFRLTVEFRVTRRVRRKQRVIGRGVWFMLMDDLRAVREFGRASGLRIEGWEGLGTSEVAAADVVRHEGVSLI